MRYGSCRVQRRSPRRTVMRGAHRAVEAPKRRRPGIEAGPSCSAAEAAARTADYFATNFSGPVYWGQPIEASVRVLSAVASVAPPSDCTLAISVGTQKFTTNAASL